MLTGQPIPYLIFFSVKAAERRHNRGIDLELTVESAYPHDPRRPLNNLLGRARFALVIAKALEGKPLITRR